MRAMFLAASVWIGLCGTVQAQVVYYPQQQQYNYIQPYAGATPQYSWGYQPQVPVYRIYPQVPQWSYIQPYAGATQMYPQQQYYPPPQYWAPPPRQYYRWR